MTGEYEVMYTLRGAPPSDLDALRERLSELGHSVVIVGDEAIAQVHVHLGEAGAAVEAALPLGELSQIRITALPPSSCAGRRSVLAVVAGPGLAQAVSSLGGAPVLARHPELAKPAPGLRPDVERLVRDWQGEVLELVRTEGQGRRTNARVAAYGLNAIGLFLMLVAFGSTGGLVGAEIGIAGGTAVLAQRVLEAVFGDQAVREMAAKARARLLELADTLHETERARYASALEGSVAPADQAVRLSTAAGRVRAVVR